MCAQISILEERVSFVFLKSSSRVSMSSTYFRAWLSYGEFKINALMLCGVAFLLSLTRLEFYFRRRRRKEVLRKNSFKICELPLAAAVEPTFVLLSYKEQPAAGRCSTLCSMFHRAWKMNKKILDDPSQKAKRVFSRRGNI